MKQICKTCGLEYESSFEEHKCNKCKEKEENLNEKIYYRLKNEIENIMDEMLINPSFFHVTIT